MDSYSAHHQYINKYIPFETKDWDPHILKYYFYFLIKRISLQS